MSSTMQLSNEDQAIADGVTIIYRKGPKLDALSLFEGQEDSDSQDILNPSRSKKNDSKKGGSDVKYDIHPMNMTISDSNDIRRTIADMLK